MPPDLTVPKVTTGEPAPGNRVLQALPAYKNSEVRHALYLPTDWEKGKTYPVIAEYAGNSMTVKMGVSEQGYGISGGKGFLWVCLPFVSKDGKKDERKWWGDPDKTAAYARAVIEDLCENWGGDRNAVILTGHSRGAIACNLIGLRDDETAKLWRAMVPVSHYDNLPGTQTPAEFKRNTERLRRLGATPQFVCGEHKYGNKHGKSGSSG